MPAPEVTKDETRMGVIRCCRDCKPPKRNGYCHTYCEEYKAEKAAYEEKRQEANRKKFLEFELSAQRENAVHKAKKMWRWN